MKSNLQYRLTENSVTSKSLSSVELKTLMNYQAHALSDLKQASLMDRVDTKFVIPRKLLNSLLNYLLPYYSALEIDELREFDYHNCYFDTESHFHYHAHHNNRVNRYKVRQRTYVDSDIAFLEVKFKNNHGRTIKDRITASVPFVSFDSSASKFLISSGAAQSGPLRPVQIGTYSRLALANEALGERITIDMNLQFQDIATDTRHAIEDWIVVEVKQQAIDRRSPIFAWIRQRGLRKCSFSKYCMGMYYSGPNDLKRNNFHVIDRRISDSRLRSLTSQSSAASLGKTSNILSKIA